MGILHILGILLIHEGYDIIDIILNLIPKKYFYYYSDWSENFSLKISLHVKKASPCISLKSGFFVSIITDKVPSSLKELVWCWHCGPMSTAVWCQRLLHSSVWTHNITETHLQRSDQQRRRLLKRLTVLEASLL